MVMVAGESWDPELRLSLGRSADLSPAESASSGRSDEMNSGSSGDSIHCSQQQQWQQQIQQMRKKKITMFYNGQICAFDVTELQANAILSMAMRGMDDPTSKNSHHQDAYLQQQRSMAQSSPAPATEAPPSLQALRPLPAAGLSMKRSLQRFLQKRKSRIGAVSPYAHKKQQLLLFPIKS